jgi:ABC-2 type transport system permease protein
MTANNLPALSRFRAWRLTNVFTKSVADRTTLVVVTGVILFLLGLWMGPLYNSLEDSLAEMAADLGDVMTQMFGDLANPEGWLNAEMYSIMAPAALFYVAISSGARAFATESENRSIGLLAANPVSRATIALQKAGATVLHVVIVVLLCGLGTWAGVQAGSLDIAASRVVAINLHLALLGIVVAGLAMLVSVLTGRRLISMVVAAGITLVAYVWGSFAPQTDALDGLAVLSPWHWYFGFDPLTNGIDWGYATLLVVLGAALVAAAIGNFTRRDLPG